MLKVGLLIFLISIMVPESVNIKMCDNVVDTYESSLLHEVITFAKYLWDLGKWYLQ